MNEQKSKGNHFLETFGYKVTNYNIMPSHTLIGTVNNSNKHYTLFLSGLYFIYGIVAKTKTLW